MNEAITARLKQAYDDSSEVHDVMALLVAAHFMPDLDIEREIERVEELSAVLRAEGPVPETNEAQAERLAEVMGRRLGFRISPYEEYSNPEHHLLPIVLDRRYGDSTTIASLYRSVARRAGIHAQANLIGIDSPTLVRVGMRISDLDAIYDPDDFPDDRAEAHALIDQQEAAFVFINLADLKVINREEILRMHSGEFWIDHIVFQDLSPPSYAFDLIRTLSDCYHLRGDHSRAFIAADLATQLRQRPMYLRDRGYRALEAGLYPIAIRDLETYLDQVGHRAIDASLVSEALERARAQQALSGAAN